MSSFEQRSVKGGIEDSRQVTYSFLVDLHIGREPSFLGLSDGTESPNSIPEIFEAHIDVAFRVLQVAATKALFTLARHLLR
jgi:hypothetical protein